LKTLQTWDFIKLLRKLWQKDVDDGTSTVDQEDTQC
jgi:hypothetical protein